MRKIVYGVQTGFDSLGKHVFAIIPSGVLKGVNATELLSSNIMTFVDMWM
jgi:hypothetical protein